MIANRWVLAAAFASFLNVCVIASDHTQETRPRLTTPQSIAPDPLQSEILRDGAVTEGEILQALHAVQQCVADAGLPRPELDHSAGQGWTFIDGPYDSADEANEGSRTLEVCEQRFISEIVQPYFDQTRGEP